MKITYQIAVILTCHNRKDKTLNCLNRLFESAANSGLEVATYLVDDGSTDGTGEAVKKCFPMVNVIQGNGNLFWNQGMRLAWNEASQKDYDFYLWLNDDTNLFPSALSELFNAYKFLYTQNQNPALICGACCSEVGVDEFSYGGRSEVGPVVPNGSLQTCKYINGNVVLVSKEIFEELGNLAGDYTHGMGDFDYGLRAQRAGFKCYTSKEYIAACLPNEDTPRWCDPKERLSKRLKNFYSPLGLNYKEYIIFRRKFWPNEWYVFAIKAYLKALVPRLYTAAAKTRLYLVNP